MRRIICDTCKTEAPPDNYGLAPNGWLHVDTRGRFGETQDFCSTTCAIAGLQKRRAAESPTAGADASNATQSIAVS